MRVLITIAAVATLIQTTKTNVLYDQALTETYRLRVTDSYPDGQQTRTLRVILQRRGEPRTTWALTSYREAADKTFSVQRATARVLVLYWRGGSYDYNEGSTKLFIDLTEKRIEKRIDYQPARDLIFRDHHAGAALLSLTEAEFTSLRAKGVFAPAPTPLSGELPPRLKVHPLPQSTKAEWAARRPFYRGLASDPLYQIEESVTAFQEDGDRIWFGKSFYDSEGMSGVGDLGFIDTSGRYTFLGLPEAADWSVLALLVTDKVVLAGLSSSGEARGRSGGLLQYDRETKAVVVHKIPDVIHSIAMLKDVIFAGTDLGLYVIRNGAITRYRMEPDINGNFVAISQRLQ